MPKFDGRSHTITIHDDAGHGEPPPTTKIHASPGHDRQEYPSSRATEQRLSPPPSASATPPSLRYSDMSSASLRHSDMSEVSSWLDPSEPSNPSSNPNQMQVAGVEPGLVRSEATCPGAGHTTLVRSAGCWAGELTLAQPWRSHTLKGLSQDCIAHWTDSNEAEFRDGMYHSHFKWRVFMMSSLTFSVCLIVIVEPCLTMLAVLALPGTFLLLSSQIAAHRMVDKRRGRQLGQCAFLLIWIAFAGAVLLFAIYATSGAEVPAKDPAVVKDVIAIARAQPSVHATRCSRCSSSPKNAAPWRHRAVSTCPHPGSDMRHGEVLSPRVSSHVR